MWIRKFPGELDFPSSILLVKNGSNLLHAVERNYMYAVNQEVAHSPEKPCLNVGKAKMQPTSRALKIQISIHYLLMVPKLSLYFQVT